MKRLPLLLFVAAGFLFLFSCRKSEKIDTSPGIRLAFSADTVYFDTVFATIGSVTQQLRVYNENDQKVRISTIQLAGGESSYYRLNIDGIAGLTVNDVDIPAHDSIFIFVKVTVDPSNQNNPLVIADSILFTLNGSQQNVKLVAWGQDAIFHK
ncbi:MAG TPA: hypothetical protein VMC08_10300, partial [Bacteroidales bacterium]|nr:hypothetical protein [Bacteroidales bacterium]